MRISLRYDMFLDPCSNTNWCELCDHMVTQLTTKIEIWSWKAEKISNRSVTQ